MKSKIIKVSIVLIFIMFSACFFNFCFAYSVDTDIELSNTVSLYYNVDSVSESLLDFPLYKANFSYNVCNTEHKYKTYYMRDTGLLYCIVSDKPIIFECTYKNRYYLRILEEDGTHSLPYCDRYKYDDDTGEWSYDMTFDGNGNFNMPVYSQFYQSYLLTDYTAPVLYGYATVDSTELIQMYPEPAPSIDMRVVQTGTRTGHVEFTPINWDSHMYYIKDDMDELVRLIAEEELSPAHNRVKAYNGPVSIEYGEYVMGMLFDDNNQMIFSQISDSVTINHDSILDSTHKLHLNKEDEDTYYLSIHGYEEGDYVRVSDVAITSNLYDESDTLILNNGNNNYNGLMIGYLYETELHHFNRKITVNKNGITYFYLYDKSDNLINSVILNSSNYFSGEEYNFDVDLSYGNNKFNTNQTGILSFLNEYFNIVSATEVLSKYNHTCWVKVNPTIDVPSIDKYELYLRISDYGSIGYIDEEDRNIFMAHDNLLTNNIGVGLGVNSNTEWHRIDDKIYDYFYLATLQDRDAKFTFELQLRSSSGQVIETKTFTVNLSASNKNQGTVSSSTNGKDDTYVRDPDELSGTVSNSNKFDFSGLNDLSEQDLKTNVEGLIDSSIGFFGLFSTIFLLLPTWISSLLYLFFFGMIIITLLRFIRGS